MTKFILVPDTLSFQESSIRSGTHSIDLSRPTVYTSQDVGHISVEQTRFSNDLLYDPLTTYTSWYGNHDSPLYQVNVQSWMIQNCLWSKTEISDWVEQNSSEVCFAKKTYGDDWNLHFIDVDDMARFQEWLRLKSANTFPFIKCPPGTDISNFSIEVEEWCKENFKGKYRIRKHDANPPMVHLACQSEDDLILVRLRWSDNQDHR